LGNRYRNAPACRAASRSKLISSKTETRRSILAISLLGCRDLAAPANSSKVVIAEMPQSSGESFSSLLTTGRRPRNKSMHVSVSRRYSTELVAHSLGAGGRLPWAGRLKERSAMRIRLKNPLGHPRFDFGSKMTAFPSLRIRTSFPSKRKSLGSRTACDPPVVNNFAVSM
jgi:hypothetical protein